MGKIQFLEDLKKPLWAQIEEMEHQTFCPNINGRSSLINVLRKMHDERLQNQEDAEMEKILEEMEHHLDQELSSMENLILKMQDELLQGAKSFPQRIKKKETSKKPVAFSPELKICDQKLYRATIMKLQQALFGLQTSIVILEAKLACSFHAQSYGRKSVKNGTEPQDLRDRLHLRKDFTTHFYAEGFAKGREGIWPVEVATKSVRGKDYVPIGSEEQMWAMGKWIGSYPETSLSCGSVLSLSAKTKEVQGYLNSAAGQVGFFGGEMGAQIDAISEVPLSAVSVQPFFYM